MKIIKLLLNAILIVSFLCGCSKNIDKKEDAPPKTEENKKEDNKVNRQENNPNDKNNINNNEVINKTQDGEKSPNNEASQVKETPKETNRKVRLNVTPQVQKVWYYCAPTSVSMILSYRGVYVDQFTLAKEMGTYEPFGTHNKDAIRVLNKYMFGYEYEPTERSHFRSTTPITAGRPAKCQTGRNFDFAAHTCLARAWQEGELGRQCAGC